MSEVSAFVNQTLLENYFSRVWENNCRRILVFNAKTSSKCEPNVMVGNENKCFVQNVLQIGNIEQKLSVNCIVRKMCRTGSQLADIVVERVAQHLTHSYSAFVMLSVFTVHCFAQRRARTLLADYATDPSIMSDNTNRVLIIK